jgi:hypothetical protein
MGEVVVEGGSNGDENEGLIDDQVTSQLKRKVVEDIRNVAQREGMRYYEVPRDVLVVREGFSEHNHQRTVTGKLNRRELIQHYGPAIEAMYSGTTVQMQHARKAIRSEIARTVLHDGPATIPVSDTSFITFPIIFFCCILNCNGG